MKRKDTMSADDGFVFTGGAVAFGARLDVPQQREVRGSITLPGLGGNAIVQEGPTEMGLMRFRSAMSSVTGEGYTYSKEGRTEFETRVACSVEGLDFAGLIRADYVGATLISTFLDHHRFREETVTLRGLWVDGSHRRLERKTPRVLQEDHRNLKELTSSADSAGLLTSKLAGMHSGDSGPGPEAGKLFRSESGRLVCYLFEPSYITFSRGGIKYELFLGEYVIDEQQRRLTMMRMEAHPVSASAAPPKDRSKDSKEIAGGAAAKGGGPQGSATAVQPLVNGHKPP
jgi:hypothetical protein